MPIFSNKLIKKAQRADLKYYTQRKEIFEVIRECLSKYKLYRSEPIAKTSHGISYLI